MSLSRNSCPMSAANVGGCWFTSHSFRSFPALSAVPPARVPGRVYQEVTTACASTSTAFAETGASHCLAARQTRASSDPGVSASRTPTLAYAG